MAAAKILQKPLLFIATLSSILIPVLAEEANPLGGVNDFFKMVFGLTEFTPDGLVWFRFVVFVLSMIAVGLALTRVEPFKEKTGLATFVAIFISFIGVRFMTTPMIIILMLFLAAIVPAALVFMIIIPAFKGIASDMNGESDIKNQLLVFGVGLTMIFVGWALYVFAQEPTVRQSVAGSGPGAPTAIAALDIGTTAGIGFIIAGIAFAIIFVYSRTRSMATMFRSVGLAFGRDSFVEGHIGRQIKDLRTAAGIDRSRNKIDRQLIRLLEKADRALRHTPPNVQAARSELILAEKEIKVEINMLRKEVKILEDMDKHAEEARNIAEKKEHEQTSDKLAAHIAKVDELVPKYGEYLERLEVYEKRLELGEGQHIKLALEHLLKNQHAEAIVEINKAIQLAEKVSQEDVVSREVMGKLLNVTAGLKGHAQKSSKEDLIMKHEAEVITVLVGELGKMREYIERASLDGFQPPADAIPPSEATKYEKILTLAQQELNVLEEQHDLTDRHNILIKVNAQLLKLNKPATNRHVKTGIVYMLGLIKKSKQLANELRHFE